jgi:hypothetical protein
MKTRTSSLLLVLATSLACTVARLQAQTQTVESMPPVVVKTVPQSGAKDVEPGTVELQVTFSKEMQDNSWSWSTAWQDSTPEFVGKPKYATDQKTCIAKVKLEPGKTYAFWLNSSKFHGFQDKSGKTAVPYLLIFKTKEK